ncbi:hypothetical protein [Intestinicryptomonas porci]|uniref:Uncharacterized protein n=1 Tax=Intestinicryptomonas porci TaxID=2926320 RepID=A0ABU4WKX6_9BACT|nr:hypothetical protein [Opitutales bacterium CLA-KB-P66]
MKIKLHDGVYAEIKSIKIVFDLVDDSGAAIENEDVKQSPNSVAEISGDNLDGVEIPRSILVSSVFAGE